MTSEEKVDEFIKSIENECKENGRELSEHNKFMIRQSYLQGYSDCRYNQLIEWFNQNYKI